MKVCYEDSCLIEIKVGDKVQEICSGRVGILKDMRLVPNCRADVEGSLIAMLYVVFDNGRIMSATENHFTAIPSEHYNEFYPSEHLGNIS